MGAMQQMMLGAGRSGAPTGVGSFGGQLTGFTEGGRNNEIQFGVRANGAVEAFFPFGNVAQVNELVGDKWFSPLTPGVGARHWVRVTTSAGTPPTGPGVGTWLLMTADFFWSRTNSGAINVANNSTHQIDISTSASGFPIVASGTIRVTMTRRP